MFSALGAGRLRGGIIARLPGSPSHDHILARYMHEFCRVAHKHPDRGNLSCFIRNNYTSGLGPEVCIMHCSIESDSTFHIAGEACSQAELAVGEHRMSRPATLPAGIEVSGHISAQFAEILTSQALSFAGKLARNFDPRPPEP